MNVVAGDEIIHKLRQGMTSGVFDEKCNATEGITFLLIVRRTNVNTCHSELLILSTNDKFNFKMKASERLKLIRQITERLGEEEWSIINLTLEQFGISISRSSRLQPAEYVLRKISKANDDIILDLANHLEISVSENKSAQTSFWKEGNVRLFISHLAREKKTASALKDELEPMAISGFVAHADITPSKEWQREIEIALDTSDALVALMEDGFHKSYWTDQEVGFAIGRGLPIIPVNMGEHPYGFLAKFQACKFQDVEKLADLVVKLLLSDPRTSRKMSEALMARFEASNSFASAGTNLRLLRKLRYWDRSLLERLKIAPKKNDQIRGAFDVPEGVTALYRKVKLKMAGQD